MERHEREELLNPVSAIGRAAIRFVAYFGELARLVADTALLAVTGRIRWRLTIGQVFFIGFGSQPVVVITGAFTGAVFAAQIFFKFSEIGLGSVTGPIASIAMCRELGPVMAGLMVAGRIGAAMAAEIGTMRVTEQIDALRAMGVPEEGYLVLPRVIAILISLPILVVEAIVIGIYSARFIIVNHFGVPEAWFAAHVDANTGLGDFAVGLIKGFAFGGMIVFVSCHQGLNAADGAVGVGRATTRAVVYSSLMILVFNLFLTLLLNELLPMKSLQL